MVAPNSESAGPSDDGASSSPVSEKKVAANRANAARSTGPRTAEGKGRSRLNATRHGLRAVLPVEDCPQFRWVVDDDPNGYDDLRDALAADLRARGAAEQLVVERLARAAWRLRRTEAAEVAMLDAAEWGRVENVIQRQILARARPELHRSPCGDEVKMTPVGGALAKQFTADGRSKLLTLMQYQARLEGQVRSCLRDLRQLRADRAEWAAQAAAAGEPDEADAPPARSRRRKERHAPFDLEGFLVRLPTPDDLAEEEEEAVRKDSVAASAPTNEPTVSGGKSGSEGAGEGVGGVGGGGSAKPRAARTNEPTVAPDAVSLNDDDDDDDDVTTAPTNEPTATERQAAAAQPARPEAVEQPVDPEAGFSPEDHARMKRMREGGRD